MDSRLLPEYLSDNKSLMESEFNYDVKITVGEGPNKREFNLHSTVLYSRCTYFNNALTNAIKQDGYYILEKPNISVQVFGTIIKFFYTCETDYSDYTGEDALKLLVATDELGLRSFYNHAKDYFIENHEDYISRNLISILRLIYSNENFAELKDICMENLCADGGKLFESVEFKLLEKQILLDILRRDDFVVNELDVWDNVLKWALAKHPELNNDNVGDWTSQNFTDFGLTLRDFTDLIRYRSISDTDYLDKITPYQASFPRELWSKIHRYYVAPGRQQTLPLLPPRSSNIESFTINKKLTLLFASWIDKKDPPYSLFKKVKYIFKLLYYSSRDGLNTDIFHQRCNNINGTLVVAKIKGSEQLVGGYNPLDWNGGGLLGVFKNTTISFIFNVADRNDIKTGQCSHVIDGKYEHAIWCDPYHLPYFGKDDLRFYTKKIIKSSPFAYNNIGIEDNSEFEEFEVFQVIDRNLIKSE